MQKDRTSILLIGSGRLARHLNYWNSLLQSPNTLITWNRSDSIASLNQNLAKASIVWLAISDSAIVPFYEQHLAAAKNTFVHFSGALNDARLLSAHPLMSFPHELFTNSVYENIHFALTGPVDLNEVLPGFKNSFSALTAENKSLYHALCVVSGNFPQLLWSETFPQLQKWQIPEKAFANYIKQITENFIQLKGNAVTGPIVRKDFSTIEKNLAALSQTNLQKLYQVFTQTFLKEPKV
ncbi:MAG: DUF2520 domain-containing protein [Bdellovibrio sp.]|nr:DUF2520 domain-containing protein [Bdellovibrio sp.]